MHVSNVFHQKLSVILTGFKAPLSVRTSAASFAKLDEGYKYLSQLRGSSGELIIAGPKKTGVLAFMIDILSIKGLYTKFISHRASFFCGYRVCQDHIELLFNCIRR